MYRLLRLFMPAAKKTERAHAAAPPSKSQARTGLRFAFYHEAMVPAASETPFV